MFDHGAFGCPFFRGNETFMTDGRMGSREACKGVLLPVKVLEYARQGGDWYLRVQRDFCCGWRPRHPVTGATLNASSLLAWAAGELGSDDKIQEAADLALVELEHIALNDVGDVPRAVSIAPRRSPRCLNPCAARSLAGRGIPKVGS